MSISDIIPKPNGEVKSLEGVFLCPGDRLTADCGNFDPRCLRAFAARLEKKGLPVKETGAGADIFLKRDAAFSPEAYALEVRPQGITITAGHESGIIQGLVTLYESLDRKGVPCFSVTDEPRYIHRGFMLDCVRHFFDPAEIERIIEQMALVKMNVFYWHLSDDQGWRIESNAFPRLNGFAGEPFYVRNEIRRIIDFAGERGVEVVPEIDMPGHATALLAAYPELSCRGEPVSPGKGAGIFKTILCAGKEQTYSFLFELLDDICDLFDSPFIHLGGDEAPKDEWEHCEHCVAAVKKHGLSNFEDLQGHFTARLAGYLAAKGKRVMCWNDVLKARTLPDNMDIQYWLEDESSSGKTEAFFDKGGTVIFADMFNLYFDYPESFTPLKKVFAYEPLINGRSRADFPNTAGIKACLWTERIDSPAVLERAVFPRLFALAETAWTYQKDYRNFEDRVRIKLKTLEAGGVFFNPLEHCNPGGEQRLAEIAQFLREFRALIENANIPPAMREEMSGMLIRGFNLPAAAGFL
jgi:hexosaminidase